MTPLPKRKISKGRRNRRRSHHSIKMPHLVQCPQCNNRRLAHRACPECGVYRGRTVLEMEEDEKS